MKNTIFIFCLSLISIVSRGQDTGGGNYNYGINKLCVTVSPLALMDLWTGPSYRGGAEFKVYKNFSIAFEGGKYFPNALELFINNQGFTINTELKYYIERKNTNTGAYVSLEYFYKEQNYNFYDSFYGKHLSPLIDGPTYFKTFNVSKYVTALTAKIGGMAVSKYNFVFDGYIGLGIRFKNAISSLDKDDKPKDDSESLSVINWFGKLILPNFELGVKIGYKIW